MNFVETSLLIAVILAAICAVSLLVILHRIRSQRDNTKHKTDEQLDLLRNGITESNSAMRELFIHQLGNMQRQIQENIGSANLSVGKTLQESLQSGRVEQQNVLQQSVEALERKFGELQTRVDQKLSQTVEANRKDLANVADRLSNLHEATGQIVTLSQGIHDLHTLLKTPALRGVFGEWSLERMLEQILGNEGQLFKRQYSLPSGERADVVIVTRPPDGPLIAIDSKFPATAAERLLKDTLNDAERHQCERQFAKDVLTKAKDISEKYIQPPITMDFAFMFVPTESVFLLLLQQRALHTKLIELRVIPTSPNSFYAYLQALSYALRGLTIHEQAVEIQNQLAKLSRDFDGFAKDYGILGTHLDKAVNKYSETLKEVEQFQSNVAKVQSLRASSSPTPQSDDPLVP